jgi:Zn-dependent protease with chaperone function
MSLFARVGAVAGLVVLASSPAVFPEGGDTLDGYAEWRKGYALIVDGQRVISSPGMAFKGEGAARDFDSIPLGYEVKVAGTRDADGALVARKIEAKPNGSALFEGDLKTAFDQMEAQFLRAGRMFDQDENGRMQSYGRLYDDGPEVERTRRIARRLVPPYLTADQFRVYVVDNKEWNAMAAPNYSIYVFTGLLRDMDDDEVAIILGHELVHASHEHSRKGYKKSILVQLAAVAGLAVAGEAIDNKTARAAAQVAVVLAAGAWQNGYGRSHEDQADRVGLRYAYEGEFEVSKGPGLWNRFATKYGSGNKALNFFFGNHSVAKDRARNLERELRINYPQE